MSSLLVITLSLLLPCLPVVAARGNLIRGASIAVEDHATDVLVSPDGTFAAGFYNASPTVFTFSVWFARSADRAVVWTATRARPLLSTHARPVHSKGSRLTLDKHGALVLTDYDGRAVWNSTAAGAPTASHARLDDSGNLVVEDADGNILWQSFDFPTDTLLPTQQFTAAMRLVSRDRLLSSGYYSLGFNDYAMLSLFYDNHNFSSIYWPNPYNNYVANNRKIYNFTREAAMDALGKFLASDNATFEAADLGSGVRRRLTLNTDGNLRLYSLDETAGTWTVSWMAFGNPCIIHGVCGANAVCLYAPAPVCVCAPGHERADPRDWSRGCRPVFRYNCSRPTKLMALPHTDFWGYDLNTGEILPFDVCARKCRESCACVAFQHGGQYMACFLKSVLFNGRTLPGQEGTLYIKVPRDFDVPEFHVHQWKSHGGVLAIHENIAGCAAGEGNTEDISSVSALSSWGGSDAGKPVWSYLYGFLSALFVVEAVVIGFGCWLFSKKGLFRPSRVWAAEEGYRLITSHFRRYSYAEIKKATGNFTDVIGRGGSGVVYKGVLLLEDERVVVAVKVLKNVSQIDDEFHFQAELSVIGRIYHMNLVRMWGCCSQGKHRILVSEYIHHGSLAKLLFDRDGPDNAIAWTQRFRIALGVARGLAYLHSECSEWIIHCDMKPENILLDQELEPKITDFGLAKLLSRDGSDANLSRIRGTRGYMAPEWVSSLPITDKVDVYSYGVVLLELVKGVRMSEWVMDGVRVAETDTRVIVNAIRQKMQQNSERLCFEDLMDRRLNGDFRPAQAKLMVELALSCLEEDRSRRPSMNVVVQALISIEEEAMVIH